MGQTPESRGTKQRILDAALELFSAQGFSGTSVEQIASKVGIKAPSLYKHFKSKQDIFDAILDEMDRHHQQQVEGLNLSPLDPQRDVELFRDISAEGLCERVIAMVRFIVHDRQYAQFRRMLRIEQYHQARIAQLYSDRYMRFYLDYHTKLFEGLMQAAVLRRDDAEVLALQYFSPILVAIDAIDRHPEQEDQALDLVRRHVIHFMHEYGTVPKEG